jgi:hypothetical protein
MLGGILVPILSDRPHLSKDTLQFVDFQDESNRVREIGSFLFLCRF